MPYPSQVDKEIIVNTAYTMIEQEGVDSLSLARLAAKLGIKAPSLYRHVPNKAALFQAINLLTFRRLFEAFDTALQTAKDSPKERLTAILLAYRAFAHANPETYVMAFTTTGPEQQSNERILEQMVLPVQSLMAAITGPEQSLTALRGALALGHGFVMLELKAQFRRGGNLTEAFEAAIGAYLAGWESES